MNYVPFADKKWRIPALFCAVTVGFAPSACAENPTWDFTGYLYLWGPALGGETTTGNSIDISFSEMLDNLDFGLMGAVEARRGKVSVFVDALYLNLSNDQDSAVGPGIPASAGIDVEGTVFAGSVGYDLIDTTDARFTVLGGARSLNLDNTVDLAIAGGSQRVSGSINNWDAVVGIRGTRQFSDRWGMSYYADIGAGESDLTTQLSLAANFKINNWDLVVGYRYLDWNIGNSQAISDLTFDGPFIGARFDF